MIIFRDYFGEYCAYCFARQYNFAIGVQHHLDCIYHPNNKMDVDIDNCKVCGIELNDCNWAYWIVDRKVCRNCESTNSDTITIAS